MTTNRASFKLLVFGDVHPPGPVAMKHGFYHTLSVLCFFTGYSYSRSSMNTAVIFRLSKTFSFRVSRGKAK